MNTLSAFARALLLIAFTAADASRRTWSGWALLARQREQPQDEACA
jgi:hypothetical protein